MAPDPLTTVLTTGSPAETQALGEAIGRACRPGDWLGLTGELGAGKTCLVKGIAVGAGVDPAITVTSPTFIIQQTYPGRFPLHHLDLYRLRSMDELAEIGYEDLLSGEGVCVVEWCELIPEAIQKAGLLLVLEIQDETTRLFTARPLGARGAQWLRQIRG